MLLEIVFAVLALIVARIFWRRWKYDLHRIPSFPALPLVGHTFSVVSMRGEGEMSRYIGVSWRKLGEPKALKLKLGSRTLIFVRDLDCMRNVVMSKTTPFSKTSSAKGLISPMIGNDPNTKSLSKTLNVTPYTKAVRRVYTSGLQSNCLKAALPKLNGVIDKMIEIIEAKRQKGPVDFQELCVRMTLDAIGVVALGANMGGLDGSRPVYQLLLEAGHVTRRQIYSPIEASLYKQFPSLKGAREQQRTLDAMTAEWDALTREILAREDPPAGEEPIWHALRTMVDPDTNQTIEYKSLLAEVATVIVAGMDSTGHQLPIILALLASYPNAMEKLMEELKQHDLYGPTCRSVTLEDLGELTYLSAVIKEGLRVANIVVHLFEREVPVDMKIVGYRLPKGTAVLFPGGRWMSSEEEWGDPDVFRPERWLTGEDMSQKYCQPFSCGPRDCVGQRLANLEMRLAIVRLVQEYDLTPTCHAEDLLKDSRNGFAIESATGVWLHAEPRSPRSRNN